MNLYNEVVKANVDNMSKIALSIMNNEGEFNEYTYKNMIFIADEFAKGLEEANILAGDRVGILAESSPNWCMSYLGINKINATAVLIDASLPEEEIAVFIERSMLQGLIVSKDAMAKIGKNYAFPIFQLDEEGVVSDLSVTKVKENKVIDGKAEVSTIIYSSGTTKRASGIMHSNKGLISSALSCCECNSLSSNDRFLAILPNSHIYGLICQIIGPLLMGGKVCYISDLSGENLVAAFKNFKPTILPAVPRVYEMLKSQIMKKINSDSKTKKMFEKAFPICLSVRRKTGYKLGAKLFKTIHNGFGGSLRILCSAGAPLDEETAEFFYGTGFDIEITYGATETGIPTIGNYGKDLKTDSCGKVYPGIEVKNGENGELLIKSPYQMLGYFQDEEATKNAYDENGWFKSGDIAEINENGIIKILGRCKDNIVLGTGKKIAPDDIENAYANIAGIDEIVVCGVPVSSGSFDEVHAFIVAKVDKQKNIEMEIKNISKTLSTSMKLTGIHFVDEIPKTSLQKPKRFLLRKLIEEEKIEELTTSDTTVEEIDINKVVLNAVKRVSKANDSDLELDTKLFIDLAIDSLSTYDLAYEIEEKLGVRVDKFINKGTTLGELIEFVSKPVFEEDTEAEEIWPVFKKKIDYVIFKIAGFLISLFYKVKIKNDKVLPEDSGYIICSNHVSNFDYLYLTLNFNKERFYRFGCMAKKELFSKGFLNKRLARVAGMIPVDRGGVLHKSMTVTKDKLKEHWGVLIHPEGTRSKDGSLGDFKRGAAALAIASNVSVVPAYIKGGYEVFPQGRALPRLFNWKKFKKFSVEVIYGEPISSAELTEEELMGKIEYEIKKLSNQFA